MGLVPVENSRVPLHARDHHGGGPLLPGGGADRHEGAHDPPVKKGESLHLDKKKSIKLEKMNLRGTQPARWAQVAPRWPSPALCGRQSGQAGLQAFALAGPEWLKTISIAITRLMLARPGFSTV